MEEIGIGEYFTRNGTRASVWEWGRNTLKKVCWIGTVQDVGFGAWDRQGRDMSGDTDLDLVAKVEENSSSR